MTIITIHFAHQMEIVLAKMKLLNKMKKDLGFLKKMQRMKKLIWILMIVLLASTTLAATKPIAGQIVNGQGIIELFVEVNFIGQKQNCTVSPSVETSSDGGFATNLGNLVFINFPVKCDSFWRAGDKIWYEIKYDGELYQSESQELESGTGLQYLNNLILSEPETPTNPPSGGGGGGGGGSSSNEETPAPVTPTVVEEIMPEVEVQLSKNQQDKLIQTILNLNLLNNVPAYVEIKVILSDKPNNFIIETKTEGMILKQQTQKTYDFDLSQLTPGQYKLQAFIYHQNQLITISNIEEFQIESPPTPLEELPAAPEEQGVKFGYGFYLLVLCLIIITFTAYKTYKKMRSYRKK